jgi:hypothetical protein
MTETRRLLVSDGPSGASPLKFSHIVSELGEVP